MNIVVKTASGKCIVRPDTTWERDNEDFFPPEFVDRLSWSPVLFARVCKPGRSVGEKFAGRYYDEVNYGVLLFPEDLSDGGEESYACLSCLDHTSFLPYPTFPKDILGVGEFTLTAEKADSAEVLFRHDSATDGMIRSAIDEVTKYVYIRIGDLIAIELQPRKPLCSRSDRTTRLTAMFAGTRTTDFQIKY